MELKKFIDKAFEKYEESPTLIDFKEELLTNLEERLSSLEANGLKRTEALKQIEMEFSDINKIADEMSLRKKQEIFEMKYMSLRSFVSKTRAAIYTILSVFVTFGIITAGLNYLTKVEVSTGLLTVFLALPLSGFVYLGLTQETASRHPMRSLRASIYAFAVLVFLLLAARVPKLVISEAKTLEDTLRVLIPFALPNIGTILYLIFTESDYRKAWVLKEVEKHYEWSKNFESSGNAQTFGILTAAIWILALGAFVLLLILKLWIFSWIPLVVATALMMLLLAHYMKK